MSNFVTDMFTKAKRLKRRFDQISEIAYKVDELQKAIGHLEARLTNQTVGNEVALGDFEFKVYSQWGEDGIIQFLVRKICIPNEFFVEFGVYDYRESNTRFLLTNNNWSGLVIDSSKVFMDALKQDPISVRNDLRAVSAFITRENINDLLIANGVEGDIGLLSIDIDGNDYWVWEAITCISPRIVICEYDSLFGASRAVTTPYSPDFDRSAAHYSFLYGGASISALYGLGMKKGYSLVGSNSAGNNAFFVRNDALGDLKPVLPHQAYRKSRFRFSKDYTGKQSLLTFDESRQAIADMPVIDLEKGETIKIGDIS